MHMHSFPPVPYANITYVGVGQLLLLIERKHELKIYLYLPTRPPFSPSQPSSSSSTSTAPSLCVVNKLLSFSAPHPGQFIRETLKLAYMCRCLLPVWLVLNECYSGTVFYRAPNRPNSKHNTNCADAPPANKQTGSRPPSSPQNQPRQVSADFNGPCFRWWIRFTIFHLCSLLIL